MMNVKKKKNTKNLNIMKSFINFHFKEKNPKEQTSEFVVELSEIKEKDKIMENSYAMFQIKVVLNFQRSLLQLVN